MKCPAPIKIQVSNDSDGFRFVAVGQSGRGRRLVKVPVHRNLDGGPCPLLGQDEGDLPSDHRGPYRCPRCGAPWSANISPEGGRYFAHPESHPNREGVWATDIRPARSGRTVVLHPEADPADRRALVYLRDRSGFRGSWRLVCGVLPPPPDDFPSAGFDPDPDGVRAAREEMVRRDHPTPRPQEDFSQGPVWWPAGDGRVAVVAQGECAQGAAGRAGGGPEYLMVMEPGATMTVIRSGRLYGHPSRLILKWDGESLTETPWEDYAARQDQESDGGAAW